MAKNSSTAERRDIDRVGDGARMAYSSTDAYASETSTNGRTNVLAQHLDERAEHLLRFEPRVCRRADEAAVVYSEHSALAEASLLEALSPARQRRMRYLAWQIDLLEMEKMKSSFDRLERLAKLQEQAAAGLESLIEQVDMIRTRRSPSRKRR